MTAPTLAAEKPNIVLIYADDLGYGDLSCYGATRVQTPNSDRLAREGLRFTDVHSTAATCTPSRYSLLTGEYAFRKSGTGILPGDASLIIDTHRLTLPSMLQRAGYSTGLVGKWHLGLGGPNGPDWNGEIKPGPAEVGFGYSFIMPATADRVPCVYVENGRVVGLDPLDPIRVDYKAPIGNEPTGTKNPDLLKMKPSHGHADTIVNGVSRIGFMSGGKAALWKDEEMTDKFADHAVDFITQRAKDNKKPFFLYFATHNIHVPRVPNARFADKTPMGPRGDSIVEFDAAVGRVLDTLDHLNLSRNTLVILSSDNGPVINDGYYDDSIKKLGDHKAAGPFRSGKYSDYEGGTRMPFIVRWPGHVKAGTSSALLSQVDLLASLAALTGQKATATDAPDSQNVLPSFLGESQVGRTELIEQGAHLSLRFNNWKFISSTQPATQGQLYNLATDASEQHNLAEENPEKLAELTARLTKLQKDQNTSNGVPPQGD